MKKLGGYIYAVCIALGLTALPHNTIVLIIGVMAIMVGWLAMFRKVN
jgi:hypothetical protein